MIFFLKLGNLQRNGHSFKKAQTHKHIPHTSYAVPVAGCIFQHACSPIIMLIEL